MKPCIGRIMHASCACEEGETDMIWYALILCLTIYILTAVAIWKYAYQRGFKDGQSSRVPFPLIDELLDHRISCLGQNPSRARFEVSTSLGVEE
jgi:hypothetical protein